MSSLKLAVLLKNVNKEEAVTAKSLLKNLNEYSKEYSSKMTEAKKIWIPSERNALMMKAQSRFKSQLRDIKKEMKNLPKNESYWTLVQEVKVASIKVASDNGWHLTPSLVKKIRARPKDTY